VVAINRFGTDTEAELALVKKALKKKVLAIHNSNVRIED